MLICFAGKKADVEEGMHMKIKRFKGGSLESNGYVIYRNQGGECFIIDPGYNHRVFADFVRENGLKAKGIILTHLHHDHTGASEAAADVLDCPIYMHGADATVYRGRVDVLLSDGDILDLDGEELKILHTPGHTEGSICVMSEKSRVCFTGDTIFDTDLGRSDLPGGSEEAMKSSIRNIADRWENDIHIYPGHDDGCTMKQVRRYNTEFAAIVEGRNR